MKRTLITLSIGLGLMTLTKTLDAGQCSGGGTMYLCGAAEVSQAYQDAINNCCAGSQVIWEDLCNSTAGVWFINQDGDNSSCAPD